MLTKSYSLEFIFVYIKVSHFFWASPFAISWSKKRIENFFRTKADRFEVPSFLLYSLEFFILIWETHEENFHEMKIWCAFSFHKRFEIILIFLFVNTFIGETKLLQSFFHGWDIFISYFPMMSENGNAESFPLSKWNHFRLKISKSNFLVNKTFDVRNFRDPIRAAEMAFERAAEAAARAAERAEEEEEEDSGPRPILPYSSFFILSSTNP